MRDAVVAVGTAGGLGVGLMLLFVGLGLPGVGLRRSGVGEAEAFAVGVGVGALTGACIIGTAAPTTVSSAAAAQMIWLCRRKLATMDRDYRPRAMAVDCHPANVVRGCPVRPSLLPRADPSRLGGPASGFRHGSARKPVVRNGCELVSRCRADPSKCRGDCRRFHRIRDYEDRTGPPVQVLVDVSGAPTSWL